MKQTKYRFLLPVVTLMVAVSLVGCAKEDPNPNNPDRMTIAPLASLGTSGVEAGSAHNSSAQTKASVSGSDALNLYVARADQTSASAYGSYTTTAITAARTAGVGNQTLTLAPVQYYRADGLKTKLTGWYPGGGTTVGDITGKGYYDGANHTVSWTINGQQDVMTAPKQEGDWKSVLPAMTFDHRLTQLQFYPYAETQATVDAWGKITRIEVLNQQNTVVYNLTNDDASGAVSFSGGATNSFSAGIADGGAALSLSTTANKVTDAKQMGNPVMIVPQSAGSHTLTLRITLANNTYKDVPLTGGLTAGVPYRLYMKFTERDITIETAVAQWSDVTTSDNMGSVRIGDYLDGGIVYWIDPVDPKKFKVLSLDQGSRLMWSAKNTYVLGAAGQNTTDGKANVAAMKKYSADNTTNADDAKKTTGVFATDFPTAEFCDKKNTGGVTGWYLPAKDELKALYNAYTIAANKIAIDAGLAGNSGTAIPAIGYFWSSTEGSAYTSQAWFVDFADGFTSYDDKIHYYGSVRCVRNITPPPPPAVGDYYFTDGSFSSKLESGKTVNGVIYYVDAANPMNYKVVSLEETFKTWAAANTYVVSAAQSDTDGRANSKAIRDYFKAHSSTVGDNFDVAFPAASYCYNYAGKGGTDPNGTWYLPAKNELQYLWCAYNGKSPISWALGYPSDPADATAQAIFNAYLTTAGGVVITNNFTWSSTEHSSSTSDAWYVNLSNGYTVGVVKMSYGRYVRCVRDL